MFICPTSDDRDAAKLRKQLKLQKSINELELAKADIETQMSRDAKQELENVFR